MTSDNKGININDEDQDFTGQILRGEKTIETRDSRSLDSRIGKRTGIIRTGVGKATLVGYAIIGEPVVYDSVAKFRRDYSNHRVAPGSKHDIKHGLKYGYPLMQVERVTPRAITSGGRVIRKLNPLTYSKDEIQLTNEPTQFQADLMGAQVWQLNSPEFKKWFGESKVRNLAGKPAVLFHGTCAAGFTKFDPTKTREMGFHFGTIPQAKDFLIGCGERPLSRGNKPAIYPVYLSIQKPLFTPDLYSEDPTYFAEWLERTNHIHEWFPDESDSYYQSLNKLRDQRTQARALGGREAYELVSKINKKIWGLMRKIVMRKGYDGIRYKNENEGDTDSPSNIAWVAFSPAQVKSATQNLGKFNRRDPNLLNPYTKPELRERLKRRIMAGDKGGRPGQWSARKAQLLAAEYRKAGGGYTGKWAKSQRSLIKWMYQDWRTKSGKPSLETGERYLPAKAIEALTSAEYAATTAAKRKATGQFSRQPARIAAKTKEFRNPMTRSILSRIIEPGDRVLCYDTAKGEDFYRLWDLIHTDQRLNTESLREIEGMLDDDGVLVIESGEEPPGLRDHFRRAFRYQKLLLVQGPLNPEEARINTEKERRESE